MNIKIRKLHFSAVRDKAVKDSILDRKYDSCLIALSEEIYAVYHEEKLKECYIRDFSEENIVRGMINHSTWNDLCETPTEKIKDLTEGYKEGYWLGIPVPIICDDKEYLERQETQELGTWDTINYECGMCGCGERGCTR